MREKNIELQFPRVVQTGYFNLSDFLDFLDAPLLFFSVFINKTTSGRPKPITMSVTVARSLKSYHLPLQISKNCSLFQLCMVYMIIV